MSKFNIKKEIKIKKNRKKKIFQTKKNQNHFFAEHRNKQTEKNCIANNSDIFDSHFKLQ